MSPCTILSSAYLTNYCACSIIIAPICFPMVILSLRKDLIFQSKLVKIFWLGCLQLCLQFSCITLINIRKISEAGNAFAKSASAEIQRRALTVNVSSTSTIIASFLLFLEGLTFGIICVGNCEVKYSGRMSEKKDYYLNGEKLQVSGFQRDLGICMHETQRETGPLAQFSHINWNGNLSCLICLPMIYIPLNN